MASDWIEDFNSIVGGVTNVLKELQPIIGEPQTTVPKQAEPDSKTVSVTQPYNLPATSISPWLLVAGVVVLFYLMG